MKNIALIGPSGVGKSTHAGNLVDQLDLLYLNTGDALRDNVDNNTAMGFLAQRYVNFGELVPDEAVDALVAERLYHRKAQQGVLFDGFPRTIEQAHFLDETFLDENKELDTAIYLHISDDAVQSRLTGRLVCNHCHASFHIAFRAPQKDGHCDFCNGILTSRPDDIREMIGVRLRAFRSMINPVLKYYKESARLIVIDGEASLEKVGYKLTDAVNKLERRVTKRVSVVRSIGDEDGNAPERMLSLDEATHASHDLVLIGGPGAGKGTVAEELQMRLGIIHIASSDLFRDKLDNERGIGKLVKSYMDRGVLVPDDVTEALVEERLNSDDSQDGFILDGFPRTLSQAYSLTQIMNNARRRVNAVINIEVPENELIRRLTGRRICPSCRAAYHVEFRPPITDNLCNACREPLYQREDDQPSTIRVRIKTYQTQKDRILQYYRAAGVLHTIDGSGDVKSVRENSGQLLQELLQQV